MRLQYQLAIQTLKFTELKILVSRDQRKTILWPVCLISASENIRDTWITVEGQLVTSRYEAGFDHGEFCVDRDVKSNDIVALMCDACKMGVSFFWKYCFPLSAKNGGPFSG